MFLQTQGLVHPSLFFTDLLLLSGSQGQGLTLSKI